MLEFLCLCRVLLQCGATGGSEACSFAVVPFLKSLIEYSPEQVPQTVPWAWEANRMVPPVPIQVLMVISLPPRVGYFNRFI